MIIKPKLFSFFVLVQDVSQAREMNSRDESSSKGERGALRASSRAQREEAVAESDSATSDLRAEWEENPSGTAHDPSACTPRQEEN